MGRKSKGVAYLLWLLSIFGWLGFHRFYLGKIGTGIFWILTFGVAGFGSLYDLFALGNAVDLYNKDVENEAFRREMRENQMHNQNMMSSLTSASIAQSLSANSKNNQ